MAVKAIVYSCYGMGDLLMASVVPMTLLEEGVEVHWVCEKMGKEMFSDFPITFHTYKRNGLIADHKELFTSLHGLKFDNGFLTTPGNSAEGAPLLQPLVKSLYFLTKEEEDRKRQHSHTVNINGGLVAWCGDSRGYRHWKRGRQTNKVVLHVGPKDYFWRHKAFPLKMYKEIIGWLRGEGYDPIVVGDKRQLVSALQVIEPEKTLIGKPIWKLKELIANSCAYVGNDCGPAHLAAAHGVPTVVFFGPTTPDQTGPHPVKGGSNYSICSQVHCSPCRMHNTFVTCPRPICHEDVGIEEFKEIWKKIFAT